MPKVKFLPQNVEEEILPNESVLDLSRRLKLTIKSICNGVPACAECRVKVVTGTNNLLPPSFKEKNLIGSAYFVDGSRLSCQLRPRGDITVNLDEQIAKENAPPSEKKPQPSRRHQMLIDKREERESGPKKAPRNDK